ncbi:siderophore-interacting protein [Aeromicrobium sp. PE09-221]|nr:siderophore-interacting protein [Aeromicrobium sp. PE09-221]
MNEPTVVRDYLKNDRGVARDCFDVTGYWRR